MTDTDIIIIPEDIVAEDHDLNGDAKHADSRYKSAKEGRAEAYAELNRFRWEMTECEHGPQFSQLAYSKAVGVSHQTIGRAAAAWRIVMEKNPEDPSCAFGGESHHGQPTDKPTKDQTDSHEKAKHTASVGEIQAIAIEILAGLFSIKTGTYERHHRPEWKEAITRLNDRHPNVGDMTEDEARAALLPIANEIRDEHKLGIRRANEVKRWMATNRGVAESEISAKEAAEMVTRIDLLVPKYYPTWHAAAAYVKKAHRKEVEAERVKNELERVARMAVVDLMDAVNKTKAAARNVVNAIKKIADDEIPMSDDERTVILSDLIEADSDIHMARTLLGDEAGTDWDAAAAALSEGETI